MNDDWLIRRKVESNRGARENGREKKFFSKRTKHVAIGKALTEENRRFSRFEYAADTT